MIHVQLPISVQGEVQRQGGNVLGIEALQNLENDREVISVVKTLSMIPHCLGVVEDTINLFLITQILFVFARHAMIEIKEIRLSMSLNCDLHPMIL